MTRSLVTLRIGVDPATHAQHRRYLNDMVEHGGNFALNTKTRKLFSGDERTGKYNQVDMTRNLINFHTHPRNCLNDDTCAVGIPSPADITNIVYGRLYGTCAHLVYSREGTYLIQVNDDVVDMVQCNYVKLEQLLKIFETASDELHDEFMKRRFYYKDYIKRWIAKMRKLGLNIRFFKLGTVPTFTIKVEKSRIQKLIEKPIIRVPIDIEQEMSKRCPRRA
jgi:hypothetical protein